VSESPFPWERGPPARTRSGRDARAPRKTSFSDKLPKCPSVVGAVREPPLRQQRGRETAAPVGCALLRGASKEGRENPLSYQARVGAKDFSPLPLRVHRQPILNWAILSPAGGRQARLQERADPPGWGGVYPRPLNRRGLRKADGLSEVRGLFRSPEGLRYGKSKGLRYEKSKGPDAEGSDGPRPVKKERAPAS
jgi:hypothetical protein